MNTLGWIGVDLDGTLAVYDRWRGFKHIGEPVPAMVDRVKGWLAEGREVRIFTARVSPEAVAASETALGSVVAVIEAWCLEHIGRILPVTHQKDMHMVQLWDDRCVSVEANTGRDRSVLPRTPSPGLLASMAVRLDHGLMCPGYYDQPIFHGGVTHAQRLNSTLDAMSQLYSEVAGYGFYRPDLEDVYKKLHDGRSS